MKKSKHFAVEELVPPEVLKAEGENSWKHLSANLIDGIDGFYEILHEQIKLQDGEKLMIIINDWRWGGRVCASLPSTVPGEDRTWRTFSLQN